MNLSYIPYSAEYRVFADKLIALSQEGKYQEIGYPRVRNLTELYDECQLYDLTLGECIKILLHNNEPIGLFGALWEDEYNVFIGPFTSQKWYTNQVITYVVSALFTITGKREAAIYTSDCNIVLQNFCSEKATFYKQHINMEWPASSGFETYPEPDVIERNVIYNSNQVKEDKFLYHYLSKFLADVFRWDSDTSKDVMNDFLHDNCVFFCVYNIHDELIGVLVWYASDAFHEVRIEYIAVLEQCRKKGVASFLIQKLMSQVKNMHAISSLTLSHAVDNKDAHSLYTDLGFNIISTYDDYRVKKNDFI